MSIAEHSSIEVSSAERLRGAGRLVIKIGSALLVDQATGKLRRS